MSQTPEAKLKKKIIDYVKKLQSNGVKIYMEPRIVGGYTYRKGVPDYWIVLNGEHIEIEVKREDDGVLSTMQLEYQRYFKDLGISCFAIDSLKEFQSIIEAKMLRYHLENDIT